MKVQLAERVYLDLDERKEILTEADLEKLLHICRNYKRIMEDLADEPTLTHSKKMSKIMKEVWARRKAKKQFSNEEERRAKIKKAMKKHWAKKRKSTTATKKKRQVRSKSSVKAFREEIYQAVSDASLKRKKSISRDEIMSKLKIRKTSRQKQMVTNALAHLKNNDKIDCTNPRTKHAKWSIIVRETMTAQ